MRYRAKKKPPTRGDADAAKGVIEMLREQGTEIVGCSLCARLVLKPGAKPAPCPLCGALVTRTAPPVS